MNEHHKFIDWNFILYSSCIDSELTNEDFQILYSKGFIKENDKGLAILSHAPNWLKKWTSLTCQFIDFEEKEMFEVFKDQIMKNFPDQKVYDSEVEFDCKGLS